MIKSFQFYYDFVSPYSYLAHKEIKKIEEKFHIKINYMPIFLGGLHKLAAIQAPAFIPLKAKFMIRDCKLLAEKNNIEFKFNSYFPIKSLNLMRGALIAEQQEVSNEYVNIFFDAIWKNNLDLNNIQLIEKLLKKINIPSNKFLKDINNTETKERLKKKTLDAFEKGIFGVPSFYINNKMFFGQDRLQFVLDEAKK